MKDDLAFKQSKRLGHTRAYVIFDWMANLAIDAAGGKSAVFGSKPGVSEYRETNLGDEARKAAQANVANYDDILKLLERINPGYGERLRQGGKNTLSLLRGEIPEDVQQAVKRSSAFRSLSGGFAGSGMSKALTARDFGLTSLDLMGKGENSAQMWESLAQRTTAPYMVTAPAQAEATFKNNLYKQAVEQMKMNVAAAPDPGAAGLFNTIAAIGSQAASFGMGAMGAGMGGGGGGAAPQSNIGAASTAAGGGGVTGSGSVSAGYTPTSAWGPYVSGYNWGWGG